MAVAADFAGLIERFAEAGVEFVVVGGVAAVVQGVPTTTFDVDVVHARTPENVARLLAFLPQIGARARGHAPGTRLLPGPEALAGPGHQRLLTDFGALDLLGAIEDGLAYDDLLPFCTTVDIRGREVRTLGLAKLAELKGRSERPKDRLAALLMNDVLRSSEE